MDRPASWLLWLSPLLLAVLLMLPRLFSPQFGLFDDGASVATSESIWGGTYQLGWEANQGRFRPVYWLGFALVYAVAGQRPLWFFVGNTLLLAGIVLALQQALRLCGVHARQIWLSCLLFVLSGPVIENAYTLSKPELLQMLALLIALVLVLRASKTSDPRQRLLPFAGATLAVLAALLTKETTLAIVPVGVGWLLIGRWLDRGPKLRDWIQRDWRWYLLLAAALATLLFLALQLGLSGRSLLGGNYSGEYRVAFQNLRASSIRWAGWILRDFPHVLILAGLGIYLWLSKQLRQRGIAAICGIWMVGWAVVYLPWIFMQEYYMLPFAAGAAALAAVILYQLPTRMRSATGWAKRLSIAGLLLFFLSWPLTLLNSLTTARIQLTVDAVNQQMLELIAAQLPTGSELQINLPIESEYRYEIGLQLHSLHGRPDLLVDRVRADETVELHAGAYVLTPVIGNQPRLTVRLGVASAQVVEWDQRLKQQLGAMQPAYRVVDGVAMSGVDLPRLLCSITPGLDYCSSENPVVDRRRFVYGWEIYRVGSRAGELGIQVTGGSVWSDDASS